MKPPLSCLGLRTFMATARLIPEEEQGKGIDWDRIIRKKRKLPVEKEMRGSTSRPSPQSPKGILGSPPPRPKEGARHGPL